MIRPKDYREEIQRWGIKLEVEDLHVKLTGGLVEARKHYEKVLCEYPDLQAKLILIASNEDETLRDMIHERAAIRYSEGLSGDLFSAVRAQIQERLNGAER